MTVDWKQDLPGEGGQATWQCFQAEAEPPVVQGNLTPRASPGLGPLEA
jgi:hypothetical protein